jgi:dTDP-glucose 4,6-dehydratase
MRAGSSPGVSEPLRLLVTGGMGFIGSNFVRWALRTRPHWRLVNLDALTYAANPATLADVEAAWGDRYRFVRGDIADAAVVEAEVTRGVDVVVNFAAESHVDRSILDPAPFLRTNVVGVQVLLDACRRAAVGRVVHVSTDEVYGPAPRGRAFDETAPLRPTNPYAASKAAADLLVTAYDRTYGLPALIVRCTNNYGPYQYPEKFIPLVITRAIENAPIPIYGDGQQVRDWLFVDDHCEAICRVVESGAPGEVYNVAGAGGVTNHAVAVRLLGLLGRPATLLAFVADRPGHDRRYALDDRKVRGALGVAPGVGLEEGLARTVAWYLEHQAWWRPLVTAPVRG